MAIHNELGNEGEIRAQAYLREHGYKINKPTGMQANTNWIL